MAKRDLAVFSLAAKFGTPIAMLTGKLVYVVDDDSGFLKGISRLLCAYGLEVRTFSSAEAFEDDSLRNEAHCILLDVRLNNISGLELLQRLSTTGSQVPVVMLTADGSELTRRAAKAMGCSAFLEKPVAGAMLMKTLLDAIADAGRSTSFQLSGGPSIHKYPNF